MTSRGQALAVLICFPVVWWSPSRGKACQAQITQLHPTRQTRWGNTGGRPLPDTCRGGGSLGQGVGSAQAREWTQMQIPSLFGAIQRSGSQPPWAVTQGSTASVKGGEVLPGMLVRPVELHPGEI
jgi:hypothetical protein